MAELDFFCFNPVTKWLKLALWTSVVEEAFSTQIPLYTKPKRACKSNKNKLIQSRIINDRVKIQN